MDAKMTTLIRSGAGVLNHHLQGKKRWISLFAYLLLAVGAVAGLPLEELAKKLALDPSLQQDSTLIAIGTAAAVTFRFFQSMGRNRDNEIKTKELEERMDRSGMAR